MKILLAYGSAMARIDDMKLLGGISGGRTGREILNSVRWGLKAPLEWDLERQGTPPAILPENSEVVALTNPWLLAAQYPPGSMVTETFRTWEQYRDLLYRRCEEWEPDIVLCAPAVSNYIPQWIAQNQAPPGTIGRLGVITWGPVAGKIDSRETDLLTIQLARTPNILGGVRNLIGRRPVLVGFKLTSHGDLDRLTEHAQHVLRESDSDFVVANDLKLGLGRKFFVTPTGYIEKEAADIIPFAWDILKAHIGGFYRTIERADIEPRHKNIEAETEGVVKAYETGAFLWDDLGNQMTPHGCLAVRIKGGGFVTTTRGKQGQHRGVRYATNVSGTGCLTAVWEVNHRDHSLLVGRQEFSQEHATLNAPLLDKLFEAHPDVKVIVHLHKYLKDVPTFPYQPPGSFFETIMADERVGSPRSFNIEAHGSIATFTTDDHDEIAKWVDDPENWA